MTAIRIRTLLTFAVFFSFALAPLAFGHEEGTKTAKLKFKAYKKWTIELPKETFNPIKSEIAIPNGNGTGFATELQGTTLMVDSTGDGRLNDKARGKAGFIILRSKNAEGYAFTYAIRLKNAGGWSYSTTGAMIGKVDGIRIMLIDQNNNGRYDDFGADAMVVGNGSSASFLSKQVSIKGELYDVTVNALGNQIDLTPFSGEAGMLNLVKGYKSKGGKLVSAVVLSEDGGSSFNLAGLKKGLTIPAGNYNLAYGTITKGTETVHVKAGRMKSLVVSPGKENKLEWGGPINAEFSYDRAGDKVSVSPQKMWFYGRSGEEYYNWFPDGQSPKFIIRNAKTRKEIRAIRFGGC